MTNKEVLRDLGEVLSPEDMMTCMLDMQVLNFAVMKVYSDKAFQVVLTALKSDDIPSIEELLKQGKVMADSMEMVAGAVVKFLKSMQEMPKEETKDLYDYLKNFKQIIEDILNADSND